MDLRIIFIVLLLLFTSVQAYAQDASTKAAPAAKKSSATAKPAQSSTSSKTAKPAAKPATKPKPTRTLDAEMSGITAELSDTFFARLRVDTQKNDRRWFVRTSYQMSNTDSSNSKKNNTVKNISTQLDSELRRKHANHYDFVALDFNKRERKPATKTIPGKSGYYIAYAGRGKQLNPKFEAGLGLGLLHNYEDGTDTEPAGVLIVRGQMPLGSRLTLDSRILAIQPSSNSIKLDAEAALQYPLIPGLFARLTYSTTNLVHSTLTNGEWNDTWRLSLLLRRTN